MKRLKKLSVLLAFTLIASMLVGCGGGQAGQGSNAEETAKWPERVITINSSKAGTSVDANARVVAKYLNEYLGVNVIVNNTAGQVDAARETLGADPDGYTLCFTNNTVVINDVAGSTDFDSVEDFEIVATTSQGASSWIAIRTEDAKKWGIETLNDLYDYCDAHPEELLISSQRNTNTAGAASGLIASGLKATPADAGTTDERLINFLAGNIDIFIGPYSYIEQYVQTNEAVCLASCSEERTVFTPDIPCTYELGYEVQFPATYYLSAPKGTPEDVMAIIGEAVEKMSNNSSYAEDIKVSSQEPYYKDFKEATKHLKDNKQQMIDLGMGTGYQK